MQRAMMGLVLATLMAGCGSEDAAEKELASSSGPWIPFTMPDGSPNPAMGITGSAKAIETAPGKMRVELSVGGLPPNRAFGSHLHKLSCEDTMAGGHYQHNPSTTTPTDPDFANNTNEVWLDFTTDATGKATSQASVDWVPAKGAAKAIIVHAMMTITGGVAGPRLACLPFAFK